MTNQETSEYLLLGRDPSKKNEKKKNNPQPNQTNQPNKQKPLAEPGTLKFYCVPQIFLTATQICSTEEFKSQTKC